jgi:hypothetical protein
MFLWPPFRARRIGGHGALAAAQTMTGIEDHKVEAIPHERLREVLKKYNRLNESRIP